MKLEKNMGRILVMADIHGANKALLQCLERSNFDNDNDTLIQLGDVADGWEETKQVVDTLLGINNLISIRGNHDEWTLDWMESGIQPDYHASQGGAATFKSYRTEDFKYEVPESHLKFFRNQNYYYKDEADRIFVHGGFNRHFKLSDPEQLKEMMCWDRDLWMAALSYKEVNELTGGKANPYKIKEPCSEVFIGHTTTVNWKTDKPMNAANIWNLDTGCGFNGKLTIMDVNTKEYWQSDLVRELYPNVEGRGVWRRSGPKAWA